jgi:rRNA maturation protein Nop10
MKCPHCGVLIRSVHENLSTKRFQPHNTWKCQRALLRRQRRLETCDESEAQVLAKAKRGLEYIIERQACGKKWFRSHHAAELEAAGLPPNCEIAAIVLGLNMVTLKKRLLNGTDLMAPLRADSRSGRGSLVPLKVLFPELVSKIIIYNRSEKRRLKRKIAKVRAEAAKLKEMKV